MNLKKCGLLKYLSNSHESNKFIIKS
jgi:hypothetical protein